MEQRHLGRTGLAVSRLALGTWSWGRETGEDAAAAQLKTFLDAGGTLVDTADVYADGESERLLGRLLSHVPRDDVIVATKAVGMPESSDRDLDASRRHLLSALDESLKRLRLAHVDIWQMHAWDSGTPIEETLSVLDAAVATGRTRYVGISNYAGWQTSVAAMWQRAWPTRTPLASNQVEYSLLSRRIESEVLPASVDAGLGVLCWSPLGRGVLTGKYVGGTPADSRGASPHRSSFVQPYLDERCAGIVSAVLSAASELGVSPAAVALAWVRDRPGVTAPIIGARTVAQLTGCLESEALTLPSEVRSALDEVSAPSAG